MGKIYYPKKPQFRMPSKAVILAREDINYVDVEKVAESLLSNVGPNCGLILNSSPIGNYDSARKFRKHGPEIRLITSNFSAEEARALTISFNKKKNKRDRSVPLFLRESGIEGQLRKDNLPSGFHVYALRSWRDKKPRKIPLYNVVDGHRIFADGGVRVVNVYGDSLKTAVEGAEAIVEVPSMHEREDYNVRLIREPVHDNDEAFIIGTSFDSSHECGDKNFNNIRSKWSPDPEDSKIVVVCKHECAARYAVIEYVAENKGSDVVLRNSIVPLISRKFAEGAARALDSLLIADKDAEDEVRRPRAGELEAVYWLMVSHLGAKDALYSHLARDGKIKNYDWTMRK